jgi:hypothetical protein
MLKILPFAFIFANLMLTQVRAESYANPGRMIKLSSSAKQFSTAVSAFKDCKLRFDFMAGNLNSRDAKAVLNIGSNMCACMANGMENVWEEYSRRDIVAGRAILRIADKLSDDCQQKYVTPFIEK